MRIPIYFDNNIFSLEKAGGISVVWYELLRRVRKAANVSPVFVEYHPIVNNLRQKMNVSDNEVYLINRPVKIARFFAVNIGGEEPYIFHSPNYRFSKSANAYNIVTVHDFTYEYCMKGLRKKIHTFHQYRAIRNADYVVCISDNTKKDLKKILPEIDDRKVRVIYNGVSEDYYPIKKDYQLNIPFEKNSFFLFVGARHQYKNFEMVLDAITELGENLVVVGKPFNDTEKQTIEKKGVAGRVWNTGYINNEELNKLYNSAIALVYPSLYEGFGIPIVEAQRAGCPVISTNRSSIPEVIGDKTLLINEVTINELECKMNMLKREDIRSAVISSGYENAKRFSWDKMSQEYMSLYEEISEKICE